MLTRDELYESCEAVRQFLIDGEKFINGGTIPCIFIEGTQKIETEINIQFIPHIPSYNLDDEVFKSYGLRNPIWSAYKLIKWDDIEKELLIEVDESQTLKLKRSK